MLDRIHWSQLAATGAILLALTAASAAPPKYLPDGVPLDPGLTLRRTADADETLSYAVGQICAEAANAYRQTAHLAGPAVVTVCVSRTEEALSNVCTDRRAAVYVVYQAPAHLGEGLRSWGGPVGILCAAVAELFNAARLPGLDRFLGTWVGVGAVDEALGNKAWPRPYNYLWTDGGDLLRRQTSNDAQLAQHPQWAAAAAWRQVVEVVKLSGLAPLLKDLPGTGAAAFGELRRRAAARAPELDAAFAAWTKAVDPPRDAQGRLLLASFEDAAGLELVGNRRGVEAKVVEDGATDGAHALALTFRQAGYPSASGTHEDWRFADWSGFKTLEFDAVSRATTPVTLFTQACDAPDRGHGWLYGSQALAPGRPTHVVMHLVPPRIGGEDDRPWRTSAWFDGRSRLGEMAFLGWSLTNVPATALPVTVLLDNVRLVP